MHPPRLCAPGDERRERERVSECAERPNVDRRPSGGVQGSRHVAHRAPVEIRVDSANAISPTWIFLILYTKKVHTAPRAPAFDIVRLSCPALRRAAPWPAEARRLHPKP